ncbi:hypothetical protein BG006_000387 [Podila minutissima]|uniref:SEC7 domain-containing protein n=1 Tax=Podila minutissima TaxID=64525 RepID=A0A9P5SBH0_9FUNG|nr:hypothetical protein BG006_000387 [Podila minutissima]
MLHHKAFPKSHRGSVSTPCLVSLPTSSIEKTRAAFAVFGLKTTPLTTFTPTKVEIASFLANEILSLVFRHVMDRKSILNCSLVCAHWHDPARLELARMVQDMPFNGQGLLHAIRTRFAHDTFPILSMAVFDKLVSNLSEVYYHSNPVIKQVFAPAHAPDLLYNLIWTFFFIDQEFRNPRAQPKVTCRYFVRLMQREGAGYPLEYFDKRVLKGSTSTLPVRSMFGKSDSCVNQSEDSVTTSTIMTRGFATIPHGWHIEGDGLDKVVRFPPATKPSTLGSKFIVLQSADLMVDQEPDD